MLKRLIIFFLGLIVPCLLWADSQPNIPLELQDEGVSQGPIDTLNCSGAGVSCARSGATGTVTVSSAGGVTSIKKTGESAITGDVTLSQGSNITLTQVGNDIAIASTASATPANPTASVGLTAVNGVASTLMRSDASPALDQGIAPTWTGKHIFSGSEPVVVSNVSSLGSEKVVNGTFTGSASSWTVGSGYSYSSNTVIHGSNGTAVLSQNINAVAGQFYIVTYTLSAFTVGTVTMKVGGVSGTARTTAGTYTEYIVGSSTGVLQFTPSNTARFTIDNVSVKQMSSGSIQVAGGNSYLGAPVTIYGSQSNGSPGTTRMLKLENLGGYSYIENSFNGTVRSAIGAESSGGLNLYASSGNYFAFYAGTTSPSLFAYLYPTAFIHSQGYMAAQYGVNAGSSASNQSIMQVRGGTALEVKRVTINTTLDNSATQWLLDASSASACTGTASTACGSYSNSTDCDARANHGGGCSWFSGSSCGAFNYEVGMGTCSGTSGCSADTSSCSSASDESSCNSLDDSYGGSCSWGNNPISCSGFDEMTCSMTMGCSVSTGYCTNNYINPCTWNGVSCDGDGACIGLLDEASCNAFTLWTSCTGGGSCTSQGDESSCTSYSYYDGCSGSYDNYSCSGDYYTGNCSGTYGAACSGTPSCSGIGNSTDCGNETGCTWSSVLNATLPDGETCSSRTYWLYNDSSGGADVVILPYSGQTVNETSSYTLSNYRDWAHFAYYKKTAECSVYDGNESTCGSTSGCTQNYSSCSWDFGGSTCTGPASPCSGIWDESTCNSTTYFSSCSGTYTISKNWYKMGS